MAIILDKPCPFCGSEAIRTDCIECGYVQITCPQCGANIGITVPPKAVQAVIKTAEDELVRRWNRRIYE